MRGGWFHIYLPSDGASIFQTDADYQAFLDQCRHYLQDTKTLAYCLLPDRFHFLLSDSAELERQLRLLFTTVRVNRPIQRIPLHDEAAIKPLIRYIHANPAKHGFTDNFRTWRWSSYRAILANKPTQVAAREVLRRFHGVEWFEEQHWLPVDEGRIGYLILRD